MNRMSLAVLLLTGVAISLLAGCGSGDLPNGPNQTTITTQLSVNGGTQPWEANLVGEEITLPLPCNIDLDAYCIDQFSGTTDGETGTYILTTDAVPAQWNIGATDANIQSQPCPGGAAWSGNLTAGPDGPQIICGSFSVGNVVASPLSCWTTIIENPLSETTNCPSTITLTIHGSVFPTSHAVTASVYNDSATEVSSANVTATSSTTLKIAVPSQSGTTAIVVRDPTTNQLLGAALFTHTITEETGR